MTSAYPLHSTDRAAPSFGWPGPLLLAIAASIVFHLTLIFGANVDVPDFRPVRLPALEVQVQPTQKSEPVSEPIAPPIAEPPRKVAKPKPRPAPRKEPPRAAPALASTPVPPAAEATPEAGPPTPQQEVPLTPPSVYQERPAPRTLPYEGLRPPTPPPGQGSRGSPLPNNVLIRFTVNWGVDGLNAGKTDFIWQSKGTNYSLSSVAQYSGLVGLFKSERILQTSLGEIKDGGLRPNFFTLQRGQSRTISETATFDWSAGLVTFSDGDKNKDAPLTAGAQDILSLLFQFAFTKPPSDQFTLLVVNGRKTESYPVVVLGEQMLNLPFGQVRTVHLSRPKTREDDGLQIWLATDRHYLPVKIHFEDRKGGQTIELIATELLASDDQILRSK